MQDYFFLYFFKIIQHFKDEILFSSKKLHNMVFCMTAELSFWEYNKTVLKYWLIDFCQGLSIFFIKKDHVSGSMKTVVYPVHLAILQWRYQSLESKIYNSDKVMDRDPNCILIAKAVDLETVSEKFYLCMTAPSHYLNNVWRLHF